MKFVFKPVLILYFAMTQDTHHGQTSNLALTAAAA